MRVLLIFICVLLPNYGLARAQVNCDRIVEQAAQRHNVPAGLMSAMSRALLAKTDRPQMMPNSPWTISLGSNVVAYDSAAEMEAQLENLIMEGEEDLNLGCMQLNLIWHGDHFYSLQDMINPEHSAEYAASVLSDLHNEYGSWQRAIRIFHGDTNETERYVKSVLRLYDERKNVPKYLTQGDLLARSQQNHENKKQMRQPLLNLTFADSYAPHILPKGYLE